MSNNYKGCEGSVKVGTDVVAEVRDWSLDETTEILDVSTLGSCSKKKKAGMTDGTGSISCLWDDTDTVGQGALTNGAKVELNLYPKGDTTGSAFVTFQAIITSAGISGSFDGMVEKTFNYEATGAIVWGTVA
jgi:hypothetical protein